MGGRRREVGSGNGGGRTSELGLYLSKLGLSLSKLDLSLSKLGMFFQTQTNSNKLGQTRPNSDGLT